MPRRSLRRPTLSEVRRDCHVVRGCRNPPRTRLLRPSAAARTVAVATASKPTGPWSSHSSRPAGRAPPRLPSPWATVRSTAAVRGRAPPRLPSRWATVRSAAAAGDRCQARAGRRGPPSVNRGRHPSPRPPSAGPQFCRLRGAGTATSVSRWAPRDPTVDQDDTTSHLASCPCRANCGRRIPSAGDLAVTQASHTLDVSCRASGYVCHLFG